MNRSTVSTVVMLTCAAGTALAQPHHDDDYAVGVNGAGQLAIEGDFDEAAYLPPFSDSGINGWFGDEPGFASLDVDEPDEDFYMLDTGADIYFELVSLDPAFKVYDPFFSPMSPGDSFAFGGHEFDEHPFWHIDSDDAAFDSNQEIWNVSWRVVDLGNTGYGDSPVYTSQFTNIPAPGAMLFALAAPAAIRRRR